MAQSTSYATLKVVLVVLAVLLFVGGLSLVFLTSGIASFIPSSPQLEVSLLSDVLLKGLGVVMVCFSYLLYCASRDPVRYVGVIDIFIVLLLAFAAIDLWAVTTQNFGTVVPYHLIWLRELVRIGVAIVLWVMRPRGAHAT